MLRDKRLFHTKPWRECRITPSLVCDGAFMIHHHDQIDDRDVTEIKNHLSLRVSVHSWQLAAKIPYTIICQSTNQY